MSLVDIPQSQIAPETQAALRIRELLAGVVANAEVSLLKIRNLVREYSRATIAAELGADAADLLVVYTKLKEAIEVARTTTVEDLP